MKPFLLLLIACLGIGAARAQEQYKEPSPESQAYHKLRLKCTTPPYGLARIEALIEKKSAKDGDDFGTDSLVPSAYKSLSLREKFTYHMIRPESFYQLCDVFPEFQDEQKKIFAALPDPWDEHNWSDRQVQWFRDNRDSVVALMTESIGRTNYVGLNYKLVIVDINATSMIPLLINLYQQKKTDHDLLTVLLLLMEKNKYPPFISSTSHRKLYGGTDKPRRTWLILNPENEALIIQRATDFYNGLAHQ